MRLVIVTWLIYLTKICVGENTTLHLLHLQNNYPRYDLLKEIYLNIILDVFLDRMSSPFFMMPVAPLIMFSWLGAVQKKDKGTDVEKREVEDSTVGQCLCSSLPLL